jgi:hypothetical protein
MARTVPLTLLIAVLAIATLLDLAVVVFPTNTFESLQNHPESQIYGFTSDSSQVPYIPQGSGNFTATLFLVTKNSVGVAVGNPINMTVELSMPANMTRISTFKEITFLPYQGEQSSSPDVQFLGVGIPAFKLSPVSGQNGYEFEGQTNLVFYSTGNIGGVLQFIGQNNGTYSVTIPAAIPIEQEVTTQEYTSNQILISLELVVVALIMFEIVLEVMHHREQHRERGEPEPQLPQPPPQTPPPSNSPLEPETAGQLLQPQDKDQAPLPESEGKEAPNP